MSSSLNKPLFLVFFLNHFLYWTFNNEDITLWSILLEFRIEKQNRRVGVCE